VRLPYFVNLTNSANELTENCRARTFSSFVPILGSLPHSDLDFATENLEKAKALLRRLSTEFRDRVLTDMVRWVWYCYRSFPRAHRLLFFCYYPEHKGSASPNVPLAFDGRPGRSRQRG
jgi:hypothetical protein